MRALDDMENANAQVEVAVEEVTKARTQKIKVVHLLAVTTLSSLTNIEIICTRFSCIDLKLSVIVVFVPPLSPCFSIGFLFTNKFA